MKTSANFDSPCGCGSIPDRQGSGQPETSCGCLRCDVVGAVRAHEAQVTPGRTVPRNVINGMAAAAVDLLAEIEARLGPGVDVWAEFARQLEQRRCQVAQPHDRAPTRPASPVVLH